MMNTAYLILGANKGERLKNLDSAKEQINMKAGEIVKQSNIFITAAWGNTDQPDFYNQAIKVRTKLSAKELLDTLLQIEETLGRIRTEEKWAERTIDIDILFYNVEIINEHHLKIPHPHMSERKFVLVPMAQMAPDLEHPVLKKNMKQLLDACKDDLKVTALDPSDN